MIGELRSRGLTVDPEPGQEDFGWYLTYRAAIVDHNLVLGHRPGGQAEIPEWIGWVERAGLVPFLLGARDRRIEPAALLTIHEVLAAAEHVSNIRWHRKADFDVGNEAAATDRPDAA